MVSSPNAHNPAHPDRTRPDLRRLRRRSGRRSPGPHAARLRRLPLFLGCTGGGSRQCRISRGCSQPARLRGAGASRSGRPREIPHRPADRRRPRHCLKLRQNTGPIPPRRPRLGRQPRLAHRRSVSRPSRLDDDAVPPAPTGVQSRPRPAGRRAKTPIQPPQPLPRPAGRSRQPRRRRQMAPHPTDAQTVSRRKRSKSICR